ncbi:ATP-binding protein [Actinokineospora inagensis]|uniref:ATP-binding protein n=1 Tax=Actinokineospora inagensis TaxID=103730 RepID=UPI00041BA9DB|nr:ATP-binding protein [Actinokineospora inagensis]
MTASAASLVRTAVFAGLYLVASVAGRMTVLDQSSLSLVWPAAGVAAAWFCAPGRAVSKAVDVALLAAITVAVNTATGASPAQAAVFVVANLLQVEVFAALLRRWRPALWTWRADGGLRTPADLWVLLGVAYLASSVGAVVGSAGMWLATSRFSWVMTAVWMARNFAGLLVVGAVALCVGRVVAARRGGEVARPAGLRWTRVAEYVGVSVCTAAAYTLGFGSHGVPVTAILVAPTVWAAARLPTPFVAAHNAAVATFAVVFTLNGSGPFTAVNSHAGRALFVQLFVIVVAVVGLALALGRDERETLLRELGRQREDAARRAELKRAIIDSMADGLSVIDPYGRITLRNPAATTLLGGRLSPADTVADTGHYGFFHLDGTPLTPAEMPHVRLAAGEVIEPMDVLVRHEGLPDGRILNVRTTALPDGRGGHNAVVLYHDVTAERRHRDELAAFAGVVAHDLLNPLTAVEGWTDDADDALQDAPTHPMVDRARQGLVRVKRSSARMRNLINDLLAYTTARDATIAATTIDLTALATEIATVRGDTAAAAGFTQPRFRIGALPPVRADLVLARQLLDNLIGNAVKYTAPGTTPEVEITATRRGDQVQVTVADNGIGIPPGQHEVIFDNFHRAHRDPGYPGTGLGLTICKRIVERHGGRITATDNPTGGSRFTFTLPAVTGTPGPQDTNPSHRVAV